MILLRNFHLKANSASISTVKYRNNACVFIYINECLTNTEKARSAGQCCLQVYLLWCNRSLRDITISSFSHWLGQVGGRLQPHAQTLKIPPSVGCPPPLLLPYTKKLSFSPFHFSQFHVPCPSPWLQTTYWKKCISNICQKFWLRSAFSGAQSWPIWKNSLELKSLIWYKTVSSGITSKNYAPCTPLFCQKCLF